MKHLATTLMGLWGDVKELAKVKWNVVKGHNGIYGNEVTNLLAQFALTHPSIEYTQFFPPWLPGCARTFGEEELRGTHRTCVGHSLVPVFQFITPYQSCFIREISVSPMWLGVVRKNGAYSYRLGGECPIEHVSDRIGGEPSFAVIDVLRKIVAALGRAIGPAPKLVIIRIIDRTSSQLNDEIKFELRMETLILVEKIKRMCPILFS